MTAAAMLLAAAAAYLLGSISTGVIVSKTIYHDDVRTHGSGATGMTNMLRTYGKKAAALTALGDVCKGFIAVTLAELVFSALGLSPLWGGYFAAVFAVIGHWKPVFFGFRGGKGVLVAAGGLLALRPVLILILGAVFLLCFLPTRMVSFGSITMAVLYPFVTVLYGALVVKLGTADCIVSFLCSAVVGGLIVYMHRANIGRILSGTEYRFDGSHKKQ